MTGAGPARQIRSWRAVSKCGSCRILPEVLREGELRPKVQRLQLLRPEVLRPRGLPLKRWELLHFTRLLDLPVREPGHSEQIDIDIFLLGGLYKLIDL